MFKNLTVATYITEKLYNCTSPTCFDSAAGLGQSLVQQKHSVLHIPWNLFLLGPHWHMSEIMFRIRRHIPATQGEAESYIGLELN